MGETAGSETESFIARGVNASIVMPERLKFCKITRGGWKTLYRSKGYSGLAMEYLGKQVRHDD